MLKRDKLFCICDNEPNMQFSASGSLWCPVTVGRCAVVPHLLYGAHRTADQGTEGNVESDGIMVENNFKVYAYTTSWLQVRLLGLFCRNIACLPNKVVGQISAEPVLKAMMRGIRAENIPLSFESTVHRRLL